MPCTGLNAVEHRRAIGCRSTKKILPVMKGEIIVSFWSLQSRTPTSHTSVTKVDRHFNLALSDIHQAPTCTCQRATVFVMANHKIDCVCYGILRTVNQYGITRANKYAIGACVDATQRPGDQRAKIQGGISQLYSPQLVLWELRISLKVVSSRPFFPEADILLRQSLRRYIQTTATARPMDGATFYFLLLSNLFSF